MDGKTHRIGGLCAGLITADLLIKDHNTAMMAAVTFTSIFASLIPDIDEPQSMAGRRVPIFSFLTKKVFKHRGAIHTPLFCIGLYFLLRLLLSKFMSADMASPILTGFLVGYFSHLLLDTVTPKGVMWFWPLSDHHISTQSYWFVKLLIAGGTVLYFVNKYDLKTYAEAFIK